MVHRRVPSNHYRRDDNRGPDNNRGPDDDDGGDDIAPSRSIYDDDPHAAAYQRSIDHAWRTTLNDILNYMASLYNIHDFSDSRYYYCPDRDCACNDDQRTADDRSSDDRTADDRTTIGAGRNTDRSGDR